MRRTLIALIALMILPLLVIGNNTADVANAQGAYCASAAEAEVVRLVNVHRQNNGLGPLTLSQPLAAAASMKSRDMADRDYVSHFSPDGRGPGDLLNDVGYPPYAWAGENIAAGYPDAVSVFEGWKNSPGHNANMLQPDFTAIGVSGVYKQDTTYGWYWTQTFGVEVVAEAWSCGGGEPPPPRVTEPPPNEVELPPPAIDPPGQDFVTQLVIVLKRILSQILGG